MRFDEILEQVIALLQRQGRVSYRALKVRFDLDDEYLEALKEEVPYVHESVVEADDRGFTWIGETDENPVTTRQPEQPAPQTVVEQFQPLQETASTTEPHLPEAERRHLTILFTDLVDSTKLSGQLDAEDYREIVRAYQATCTEVIERFDCHLAQTLGDGLLVYSGYPVAHEDDAERAVKVGLAILDAMKTLNKNLEQEKDILLPVRVGIHTGLVVVGEMGGEGRHEQLALGETPNIAARVQGLAEADTVIISESTYRLIQGYFDCQELGERELRGVSQPINIYRVLQESGAQSRLEIASTRGLTPFVGREQEVGLLMERWSQVKEGHGQVVLLSGEAGIGKSRLVQVIEDHVAEEPHTRLECRSSPYYQNTALHPVIEMLQHALQWQADDTPEEKLQKLETALSQYHVAVEETVPLFATLLSLSLPEDRYSPLALSPRRQRQKTLEAILAIVLELADQQPVLFVLEDVHWLDPSTLELLSLLIDQVPTASILILLTYRPEYQHTWGNRSYLTQMTLYRLSRNQIEQMVEHIGDGKTLPAEVIEQLVDKTDGVPLYVEEMTKTVLESRLLKEVNGHYDLRGSLSSLAIPTTLQDSLMARLDRLVTAKGVAQLAATIGRQFSYELLHAVSQLDDATLQRELSRLVEAELLFQRGLPPQTTYIFKHALVIDVAYQSLLKSTRKQYHRQIIQALEEQFQGASKPQPELLAYHCMQSEHWKQAFAYLTMSGDKARQAFANQEAIAFYTQAIEVSERITPSLDNAQLLPVYEGRGLVWLLLTKLDEAIADFQMMCQIARASGNQKKEGESLCLLATTHYQSFSGDQMTFVEQYAKEAIQLFQQTGDQRILARSLVSLGLVNADRGNLTEAERLYEQALQISRHEGVTDNLAQTLPRLGLLVYWQGNFLHSVQYAQEGVAVARDIHDGFFELLSLVVLVQAYWSAGNYAQALTVLQETMIESQERNNAFIIGRLTNTLGWFHREFGDVSRAVKLDQESMEMGRTHRISNVEISASINLGLDYLALGQHERALSCLEPTLERVQREAFGAHRWRWTIRLFIGLAELSYTKGNYNQALRYLENGLDEAQRTSSQKYIALGWALRGKIASKLGDTEGAGIELQQAFTLAEQLQSPSLIYPIAYDLGQWHESTGNEREAAELYGKAKATIEQMATAVEDEALSATLLQSALVQEIYEHAARLGGRIEVL